MEEVKFEEIKEGQHYIVETVDDYNEIELGLETEPRNKFRPFRKQHRTEMIKVIKIELPFVIFQGAHRGRSFSTLEDVKFFKPSPAFVKTLNKRCTEEY